MPSEHEKYYKTLDLDVGASKEEVKKAWRELSQIYHPDNYARKSTEVQKRSEKKFKELSSAYQIIKDHLSEEDSSREAEEKTKAEQDRRDREEKERKQRERNERRKKEEKSKRKAEQDKRDREEKESRHWEEQAKKKHEKEKGKQKKTEQLFVTCPECKEEIKANSTVKLRVICNSCSHIFHYFFEDGKLRVVSDFKKNDEGKREKVSSQDSDFRWGRDFLSWALFPLLLLMFALLIVLWTWNIEQHTIDGREEAPHQVAEEIVSKIKVNESNSNKNSQSESLSWKRTFRGEIIGRQGITLNLQRNGDKFRGDYIDVHEMKKKDLIGTFDNKFPKYLVLEEYIDEKKTGSFYGNFLAGKEVEGEYTSQSEPNNKLKFELKDIDRQNEVVQDGPEMALDPDDLWVAEDVKGLIMASVNGKRMHGDRFRISIEGSKCQQGQQWFTFTALQGLEGFHKLKGKVVEIKYNHKIVNAKIIVAQKIKFLYLAFFNLALEPIESITSSLKDKKSISVELIDSEGFNPGDYFYYLNNEWSLTGLESSLKEAQTRCKEAIKLKVDKFSSIKEKLGSLGSKYGIKELDNFSFSHNSIF